MKTYKTFYSSYLAALFLVIYSTACSDSKQKDPLDRYEEALYPVKLFSGEISIDGMQWNNAFTNKNRKIFYCRQMPSRAQIVTQKFDGTSFKPVEVIPLKGSRFGLHLKLYLQQKQV